MFFKKSKERNDDAALALTRSSVDLGDNWCAICCTGGQEIASHVHIHQAGCAASGTLVGKFATPAVSIRGVIFEGQLVANYWQADPAGRGSGLLHLRLANAGRVLVGVGSWNSEDGNEETYEWRWERHPATRS